MNKNSLLKKFYCYYYLAVIFYDFIFAYVIYAVFFQIQGLSLLEISLLFMFWSLMATVFEIPTGALADYWNRKKVFSLAAIIKIGCFLSWFFAEGNFFIYALGFVFWTLADSLVSGCSEALLYDGLVFFGKKKDYSKALGKKFFFFHLALAISLLLGGVVAEYSLDLVIISSIIPLFLSAFFALKIPNTLKKKISKKNNYLFYIHTAKKEILSKPILLYISIYLFAISIFAHLEEYDTLYMDLVGLPFFLFGIFGFVSSILNALGSYYAYKLKNWRFLFALLPLLSGVLMVMVGIFPSIWAVVWGVIAYFFCSPLLVLVEAKMQNNIKSYHRATMTSMVYFFLNIFGMLLFLLFGVIGNGLGVQIIYLFSGIFLLFLSIWSFFIRKKFL